MVSQNPGNMPYQPPRLKHWDKVGGQSRRVAPGVYLTERGRFKVVISKDGGRGNTHVGVFDTQKQAEAARRRAMKAKQTGGK